MKSGSNQRNWNLCIDGVIHHQDGFEEAHDEQKADDTYEEKTYPFIEVHLVSFVVHVLIDKAFKRLTSL